MRISYAYNFVCNDDFENSAIKNVDTRKIIL